MYRTSVGRASKRLVQFFVLLNTFFSPIVPVKFQIYFQIPDHNVVKITGTIITPAKDLANDNKSIIVRTNEDTDK